MKKKLLDGNLKNCSSSTILCRNSTTIELKTDTTPY